MRVLVRLGAPFVLVLASLGCGGAGPGSGCTEDGQCRDTLECIASASGELRCMARCGAEDWLCDNGGVCLEAPGEGRVCWFGGDTSFARACTDSLECEPGTVCEGGVCVQACKLDMGVEPGTNLVCPIDQGCSAIAAGPNAGVCVGATSAAVDAGVTSP